MKPKKKVKVTAKKNEKKRIDPKPLILFFVFFSIAVLLFVLFIVLGIKLGEIAAGSVSNIWRI